MPQTGKPEILRRSAPQDHADDRRDIIRLIAAFRLIKAVFLIVAAMTVLKLLQPEFADRLREYIDNFPLAAGQRMATSMLSKLTASRTHAEVAAAALLAYAALFITEGIGLWMQKRWAEMLTVIATISFIPFEIYEVVQRVTAIRVGLIVLNVAIVVYLIYRLRQRR